MINTRRISGGIILFTLILFYTFATAHCYSGEGLHHDILLNDDWRTIANDTDQYAYQGFEQPGFDDTHWEEVTIPHNWDKYEGYRRMLHGNRHGYAWYRKYFTIRSGKHDRRYFLFFEGAGSYATIWLNGKRAGYHAGGRTTFTIDVTDLIYTGKRQNLLAVRTDHPASIRDLPWVCGGCSEERGFSEGSQPMGIFRPVHLIITRHVRIEPFGVHIWNDTTVSDKYALLNIETEVKNYGRKTRSVTLVNRMLSNDGKVIAEERENENIPADSNIIIRHEPLGISNPRLWSPEDPYLYILKSELIEKNKIIDSSTTLYGIRWIKWPVGGEGETGQFFLNGKPVFISGTAEYEHMMGKSHAFSDEQIQSRAMQVKAAGFNAFRDAHQPHNLRYNRYWDQYGILWWPQFTAHIWFDDPQFRNNFKKLLKDWVKERRNSPSLILWGLQNESILPEDFAAECTAIIRELDPTASVQRRVTTCNGGTGTDWNVIQNWSGTYKGDPYAYAEDIQRELLNGEYGAWRSIDMHTEGPFIENGTLSEDRMTQLMEMKIRLAESVRDRCCGQFHWLFNSHENPGRTQNGEGFRDIDRVGPVNYKGLFTCWGEPLDVYYMFRANYAPADKEPMVYIVSHTWPDRWIFPGKKDCIVVYSNCDEVELFNDVKTLSLGKRAHQGTGTHFQWDGVEICYNVLYATGYLNGKAVAHDCIVLNHLPESPNFGDLIEEVNNVTSAAKGYNYLFRVNCGGPDYKDKNGNIWTGDCHKTSDTTWGSKSWTDQYQGLSAFYGSQRRTFDPIKNTSEWKLFQTFRYGRDKLKFEFPVPDGDYLVELYFIEPWYGTGGSMDCSGWRLFDVALNNKVVLKNLDIWKEAGHDKVVKKSLEVKVSGGQLVISFPFTASGQAVISAIAIASTDHQITPAPRSVSLIENLNITDRKASVKWSARSWMDTGDKQYTDDNQTFSSLPSNLYGTEWIRTSKMNKGSDDHVLATFNLSAESDVFVALDTLITEKPAWMESYEETGTIIENDHNGGHKFRVYSKRYPVGATVLLGNNANSSSGNPMMYTIAVCRVTSLKQTGDIK
jgi:beta-galactosidase